MAQMIDFLAAHGIAAAATPDGRIAGTIGYSRRRPDGSVEFGDRTEVIEPTWKAVRGFAGY